MGKFFQSLKSLPDIYYNFRKINEDLEKMLAHNEKSNEALRQIDTRLTGIEKDLAESHEKLDSLDVRVNDISAQLGIIGKGTKMELFDTLYHWKKILVDDRKWASELEKKEVKEIYSVYHDGLHGNGQGEVYYNEIMALPEDPPANN
jgi:archaellum component FlaC